VTISSSQLQKHRLVFPGIRIKHHEQDWAFKTYILLSLVEDQFEEAVIALSLYKPITREEIVAHINSWFQDQTKYENRLRHMYAKMFVCAIDVIGKLLKIVCEDVKTPQKAVGAYQNFEQNFALAREIRNSVQHIEDRARGLGPHSTPLDTKTLLLGNFINNKFCVTMADGRTGGIEILENIINEVKLTIQDVINAFEWEGPVFGR
jgi:hypothetical protein